MDFAKDILIKTIDKGDPVLLAFILLAIGAAFFIYRDGKLFDRYSEDSKERTRIEITLNSSLQELTKVVSESVKASYQSVKASEDLRTLIQIFLGNKR